MLPYNTPIENNAKIEFTVTHMLIGINTNPMNRAKESAPNLPKRFEIGPPQDATILKIKTVSPETRMCPMRIRIAKRIESPPFNAVAPTPCAIRAGSASQENQPMNTPRNTSRCMSSLGRHSRNDLFVRL